MKFILCVVMFTGTSFASTNSFDISLKFKEKICKDIQGDGINKDTYDVKNCLKGVFSTTKEMFTGEEKAISYLGTNMRGYKFACQYKYDDKLRLQAGSSCIDLFIKNWPK